MGEKFGGPKKIPKATVEQDKQPSDNLSQTKGVKTLDAFSGTSTYVLSHLASPEAQITSLKQGRKLKDIDSGKLVEVGGFYLTPEQANLFYKKTAEQKEKAESKSVAERVGIENSQSDQYTQQGGLLNKLSELKQKLFGGKQENVQAQSQDTISAVSEANVTIEKAKNLTLRELQEKQNQILRYAENILNQRFEKPDELTKKYLQKNIPKIYENQEFVSFLQTYINDLESDSKTKTNVADIVQKGRVGREELQNRIDTLYGGGFKISQQRLLTMFISSQMQYLGKSIVKVSRMNIGGDKVEIQRNVAGDIGGFKISEIPTWYGEEEVLFINSLVQADLGRYSEGGSNADLFRDIRDIIGPDEFMKISKNLIKVVIESNRSYNKETGELEEIEMNKQYAKVVMAILNPPPKEDLQTQQTSNVVNIFSKNNPNSQNQLAA